MYLKYPQQLFQQSFLSHLSFKKIVSFCEMPLAIHKTHNFKNLKYDLRPYHFIKELVAGHQLWKKDSFFSPFSNNYST